MLKHCKILLIFLIVPMAFSKPMIDWKGKRHQVIASYLKVQKKYFQLLCRGGDHAYDELDKKFRGNGFFVPHLNYMELDREAIDQNISLIGDKVKWLRREKEKLSKKENFKSEKKQYRELKQQFERVVRLGQEVHESGRKLSVLAESRQAINLLREKTRKLLISLSFIKPFGYPVDHFTMRKGYDEVKGRADIEGQRKKNNILFKRRVFEDGAQNPNHTKSDRYFRAMINTIGFHLDDQKDILSENFRYDFNSFLAKLKKHLLMSKDAHLQRLEEWRDRTQRTLDFYLDLLKESRQQYTKSMLQGMSEAKHQLMDFNFKRQREVYDFWINRPELERALFILETILFNEVGNVDGRDGLERRDVAQVVINRVQIPFYRTIGETEKIYPYLKSLGQQRLAESKWLNVMFKEGEFSFTYFFIPSSKKIYCPDMSRRGRFLRRENLKIVLQMLRHPNPDFKAIRYFSRASMLGRIDMAKIWTRFEPLPQRPGSKSMKNSLLRRLYGRGRYRFLYQFRDGKGDTYHVLEFQEGYAVQGKTYTYDPQKRQFLGYRNPHFFTYFAPQ